MQSSTRTAHERQPVSRVVAEVLAVGVIAALLIPAAAFAGKGQGRGADTGANLNLVVLDGPETANAGDRVTFSSNQSETDRPFVGVRCYQGDDFVLDGYVGVFDDYRFDPWVTLGSDYWAAGSGASCEARMFYVDRRGRENLVATMSFNVEP